jgi:hypothetical protein
MLVARYSSTQYLLNVVGPQQLARNSGAGILSPSWGADPPARGKLCFC